MTDVNKMQGNNPDKDDSSTELNRRTFLRKGAVSGALVATPGQLTRTSRMNLGSEFDSSDSNGGSNRDDLPAFSGTVERLRIESFDGVELAVEVYIPEGTDVSATTYLLANNWAYENGGEVRKARELAADGNRVVKFDARGYGESNGARKDGLKTVDRSNQSTTPNHSSQGNGFNPVPNANFADAQAVIGALPERNLIQGTPSLAL